jgi:hypothetical protein
MRYNFLLTIILALLASPMGNLRAQTCSDTRRISQSYHVNKNTTVDITNKYGKIHVITWNKDSVRIEISRTVKTTSQEKLEKIKDNIDFDFTGTEYYVTVKTVFGNKYYNFFDEIKNLTESIFPSETQVTIDYVVMLPQNMNLKLDNRYGDVYADDLKGNITLSLSNGDLKVNRLEGMVDITLSMGEASINYLPEASLDLTYSEVMIRDAGKLNINTKLSKITIENASEVKLNTRRDDIHINSLEKLYGEGYFSDLWVLDFMKEASFKMKYGNLSLENISNEFSFINLDEEFTDVNLFFERDASYQLDISHKDTNVRYPKDISTVEEKMMDEENKQMLVFGYVGKKDARAKLKINGLKGGINILHK